MATVTKPKPAKFTDTTSGAKHGSPFPPTTAQDYWTPIMGRMHFGREAFRITAYRKDRPTLNLDSLVDALGWERQGAGPRTGSLTFYRPLGSDQADQVGQSDQIGIDVSLTGPKGPWFQLMRLAVDSPQEAIVAGTTYLTLRTINISQLTLSKASWLFTPDHAHPKGWTAGQITEYACRRFDAPIGRIAPSSTPLAAIKDPHASAYDVILKAWQQERIQTGRRFVVDDDQGSLTVSEIALPRYMLPLGPALAEAVLNSFVASNYCNAVVVHGHVAKTGTTKSGKPRKGTNALQVTVVNDAGVARYGYVQRNITAPSNVTTAAGLSDFGMKYLANYATPKPTVEFTHPGIPWVDVGDAIMLAIPQIGFLNLVYVQAVTHAVAAGQYTMDVTVGYKDPWLEDQSSKVVSARIRGLKNQKGSHYLVVSARPRTPKAVKHH